MAEALSITELKKHLKGLSSKEMVDLICRLYKSSYQSKQLLTALFAGEKYAQELLTDYKHQMRRMFFDIRNFTPISSIKKLITGYKKVTNNQLWITDLMLYYVECGTDFTNDYGDIDAPFYNSLCSVFGNVVENINRAPNEEIYLHLKARLSKLMTEVKHIGWGYGDYVTEAFCQIMWRNDDE